MPEFETTHYKLPSPTSAGEVKLGATDIKELAEKVDSLLYEHRFGLFKSSVIATEQERTNVAYGTLATPDEVEVELPANGLIAIGYQAMWKGGSFTSSAAIFLGANQLKIAPAISSAGPPVAQAATMGNLPFQALSSWSGGLVSTNIGGEGGYTGDVTTGQVVGLGGGIPEPYGGVAYVFAAAGTYKLTVQFKSTSGTVKVKNRKLWAWVLA